MKRNKFEIIRDILTAINARKGPIRPTRLMYRANLSHQALKNYTDILISKGFIVEHKTANGKTYTLSEKGIEYLNRYEVMKEFIDIFSLDDEE